MSKLSKKMFKEWRKGMKKRVADAHHPRASYSSESSLGKWADRKTGGNEKRDDHGRFA